MAKKGDSANGSGDVNFTAACMSVGIPLNQSRAALAVKCETGRDYFRFFLEPVSIDGAIKLDWCNAAWRARKAETGPMAGFGWLMEFIAAKPAGVRTTADWLAHAHDHLRECGIRASWTWPRQVEQIADFVNAHREDRAGHVFAFVMNRGDLLDLADQAADDPRLLMSKGREHTMVRDRAPEARKKEFFRTIG